MTKQEFLEKFSKDVLQISNVINRDDSLLDLPAWDSLAQINSIAFFDKELGIAVSYADVSSAKNMADILNIAGL